MCAIRSSRGKALCCKGQDGGLSAKVWLALWGQGNVLVITRRCHADAAASQREANRAKPAPLLCGGMKLLWPHQAGHNDKARLSNSEQLGGLVALGTVESDILAGGLDLQ